MSQDAMHPRDLAHTVKRTTVLLVATLVAAAALFVTIPDVASAVEFQGPYGDELDMQETNWTDEFSVPKFDASLGQLQTVTISVIAAVGGSMEVENTSPRAATFKAMLAGILEIDGPVAATDATLSPSTDRTFEAAAFDGEVDFGGDSGYTWEDILSDGFLYEIELTEPADLAAFIAADNGDMVMFDVAARGASEADGPGNAQSAFNTLVGAEMVIEYTYEAEEPADDLSLGDFAWLDEDGDGIQDAGEPGMKGVGVTLLKDDKVIGTTKTDASGNYEFTGLAAGEYTVVFDLPSGYSFTKDNEGNDDADSDGQTVGVTLTKSRTDIDVGVIPGEIDIEKTVALQPDGPDDKVTWQVVVRNIAKSTLVDVTITDLEAPECERTIESLSAGEEELWTCVGPIPADGVNDVKVVATLKGTDHQVADKSSAAPTVPRPNTTTTRPASTGGGTTGGATTGGATTGGLAKTGPDDSLSQALWLTSLLVLFVGLVSVIGSRRTGVER